MEKVKIGFTGAQACGKTTAILEMATDLRKNGWAAGIITENIRKIPHHLPINEAATTDSQLWIFGRLLQKEIECTDPIVICDRTMLDVISYTMRVNSTYAHALRPFLHHYIQTYDIIFYLYPKKEYLKKDGFRSTDKQFQKEIKQHIETEIEHNKEQIPISYSQDHDERMKVVKDIIKRKNI